MILKFILIAVFSLLSFSTPNFISAQNNDYNEDAPPPNKDYNDDSPAPPPGPPPMSSEEIKKYADQQARTVLNRVMDTYGETENWKATFVDSFWDSYREHRDQHREGRVEFQQGRDRGARSGRTDGENFIQSKASNEGAAAALKEAYGRYRKAAATGSGAPDTQIRLPEISYRGEESPRARDTVDLKDHISRLESQLHHSLRYDDSPRMTVRTAYDLGASGAYQPKGNFFENSREYYAWQEWENNRLNGQYDKDRYNKMDFSQRSTFEREFKSRYDQNVRNKFAEVRRNKNAEALRSGSDIGRKLGETDAELSGEKYGYEEAYLEATRSSYRKFFTHSYERTFMAEVEKFNSNSIIEVSSAQLIAPSPILPGSPLGAKINEALNIGRKSANALEVNLLGLTVEKLKTGSISIDASGKVSNVEFGDLARVKSDVWPNEYCSLDFRVGHVSSTLSYRVSWDQVLAAVDASRTDLIAYVNLILSQPERMKDSEIIKTVLTKISQNADLKILLDESVKKHLLTGMASQKLSSTVALQMYRSLEKTHELSELFGLYSLSEQNEAERDWGLIVKALLERKPEDTLYQLATTSVEKRLASSDFDWKFAREVLARLPYDHQTYRQTERKLTEALLLEDQVVERRDWKRAFEFAKAIRPESEFYLYLKSQVERRLAEGEFDEGMTLNLLSILPAPHEFYKMTSKFYETIISQSQITFDQALNLIMHIDSNEKSFKDVRAWILSEVEKEWLEVIQHWRNSYKHKYEDGTGTLLHVMIDRAQIARVNGRTQHLARLKEMKPDLLLIEPKGGGINPFKRKSFRARVNEIGENVD